jgi:hypothetical protein
MRTYRITDWRDLAQTEARAASIRGTQISTARLPRIRDSETESRDQVDAPVGRTIRERSVRRESIRRIKKPRT